VTDDHGYQAFHDPYLYRTGGALKNRLGLRDPVALERFELEMTGLRSLEPLPAGPLTAAHYKRLHRHLFQDVYAWAGRYRTVRMSKGGSVFCFPEHVPAAMDALFAGIRAGPPMGPGFAGRAAEILAELNAIHPFRDGNGRAQLTLLRQMADLAGMDLDLGRIAPAPFLAAMVQSFAGELEPLLDQIAGLIE
jgi:cell filamentation protein